MGNISLFVLQGIIGGKFVLNFRRGSTPSYVSFTTPHSMINFRKNNHHLTSVQVQNETPENSEYDKSYCHS